MSAWLPVVPFNPRAMLVSGADCSLAWVCAWAVIRSASTAEHTSEMLMNPANGWPIAFLMLLVSCAVGMFANLGVTAVAPLHFVLRAVYYTFGSIALAVGCLTTLRRDPSPVLLALGLVVALVVCANCVRSHSLRHAGGMFAVALVFMCGVAAACLLDDVRTDFTHSHYAAELVLTGVVLMGAQFTTSSCIVDGPTWPRRLLFRQLCTAGAVAFFSGAARLYSVHHATGEQLSPLG